jgi:riboflavin kinase/FMN adenylyltransferase
MLVEEELARFSPAKDVILTIGVFDGVHLGHRQLINTLVSEARRQGLLSAVVTFRQHPREVVLHRTSVPYLTTFAERERLLKEAGADIVVGLTFNRELASLSAREFVAVLQKHLRMRSLVIGPDFALGKGREGDAEKLMALGREMGFSVTVVPLKQADGQGISSTAIRNALAAGDMRTVARLLGRPFALEGKVVEGQRRGTDMGFPTANISVAASQALPPDGVYATRAAIEGKTYMSMTNIGTCPTFGPGNERTIEVFILDYAGTAYGKDLKIELIDRLREEKRFESAEALAKQIGEDVRRGKQILKELAK